MVGNYHLLQQSQLKCLISMTTAPNFQRIPTLQLSLNPHQRAKKLLALLLRTEIGSDFVF